jgi:transcription elongation GreA/GreB family factor
MSAAIQLLNQPDPYEKRVEKTHNNAPLFEVTHEQRLRQALGYIAELQAELHALREELAKAERTISQKETLLRNAMIREQELRAELFRD